MAEPPDTLNEQTTRRTFLQVVGGIGAAATAGSASGITPGTSVQQDGHQQADTLTEVVDGTVGELSFFSTASQLGVDPNNEPHSQVRLERGVDDDIVLVWTEPTAFNFETTPDDWDDQQETINYDDEENLADVEIPIVSHDPEQPVVAFGTTDFVSNDRGGFRFDNEEFLANLFDEKIDVDVDSGETATVAYEEGHGQFLDSGDFSIFSGYAADQGYKIEGTETLFGPVERLRFPSTASQVSPDGGPLTSEENIVVWAEPTAENVDDEGDTASHIYEEEDIPLVSRDGSVVGFGTAEMFEDGDGDFTDTNEAFVLNLLADTIGDSGTLLWDDAHDTYYDSSNFTGFESAIEDAGYEFETADETIGTVPDPDGELVADPSTPGEQSVHSWELTDVAFGEPGNDGDEVDTITVEYPESASFDGLDQDDVTVVMTRTLSGGEDTSEISVNSDDYSGSSATLNLSGINQTDVAGPVEITIDGIQNPDAGVWDVDFVFEGDGEEATVTEQLTIGDGDEPSGEPVDELEFFSTASLVDTGGNALTDDSLVAVWAEETAYNSDGTYRNSDDPAGEGPDIPLVAADETVVGFGSDLAPDASDEDENRDFLVNVWEDRLGGTGTVAYDESHGQELTLGDYSDLQAVAEGRGFTVDAIEDGDDFESALDNVDAVMIATSDDDLAGAGGFTAGELDALAAFVGAGGGLFLHDTSDFGGESTDELNEILDATGAGFRFNADQVDDDEHSGWASFLPRTTNFNDDAFPNFFGPDENGDSGDGDLEIQADVVAIPSPSDSYTDGELAALAAHVADGGAVFLLDESEFVNEETANLNDIAAHLDIEFRFNADQVQDSQLNAGAEFVPETATFNTTHFEELFEFDVEDDGIGIDDVDAVMITSPSVTYTADELDALAEFVDDGGAAFLFDESDFGGVDSDFGGFDETENMNRIASALDLPFRFNSDQVNDLENNAGPENDILTANYDTDRDDIDTDIFEERGDGLGIDFEDGETYFAKVVRVFDGDTFEVEFLGENGFRDTIRHIGMDTAETPPAENEPEEWFGIEDPEDEDGQHPHLVEWGGKATDFALDLMAPEADAGEEDVDGRIVRVEFDDGEPQRGNYGRLLMYMYYDEAEFQPDDFEDAGSYDPENLDEDDFDRNYNLEAIEKGYARIYSSSFARHDEWAAVEQRALAERTGIWGPADFRGLDPIRNDPVETVFVPHSVGIEGATDDQVVVEPEADASDDIPLIAADSDNGVVMVGGLFIHEEYNDGDDDGEFPFVDPDEYQSYPLVANLVDELSDNVGPLLLEGGHGQFAGDGALSLERCELFLRYIEGVGAMFRQINDPVRSIPKEPVPPRALLVTAPNVVDDEIDRSYTQEELDALSTFTDDGGVVVLIGSARAPGENRAELNRIAEALGTDLRFSDEALTDDQHNFAGDENLLATSNLNDDWDVFDAAGFEPRHVSEYLRQDVAAVPDGDVTVSTDSLRNTVVSDWHSDSIDTQTLETITDLWESRDSVLTEE